MFKCMTFQLKTRSKTQLYRGAFYPYLTTSFMGVMFLTCKLRKSSKNHQKPTLPMTFLFFPQNLTITRLQMPSASFSIIVNDSFSVLFLQLLNGCIVHSVIRVVHKGNVQILKCNRYIVKYYRCILHICMSSRIKAFYLDAFQFVLILNVCNPYNISIIPICSQECVCEWLYLSVFM